MQRRRLRFRPRLRRLFKSRVSGNLRSLLPRKFVDTRRRMSHIGVGVLIAWLEKE